MFKHPLRIKSQSAVKKSERKALFDQISRSFEAFSIPENRNLLFPEGEEIKSLKVEVTPASSSSGPAKNQRDFSNFPEIFLIFCNAKKQPLFISFDVPSTDATKKTFQNVFLPTVYALWKCRNLFPLIFSTVPEVFAKLQNGADLMLAGANFSESTKNFIEKTQSDQVFPYGAVTVEGSDFPVAIGTLLMDWKELQTRLTPGGELKGRLLKTFHVVGDELWGLGDKTLPPSGNSSPTSSSKLDANVSASDGNKSSDASVSDVVESGEFSEEKMDALFRKTLLVTLKSKVTDKELPLLASTLNGQMMSIGRRISSHSLDIKHTSYRKFSKFLEDMEAEGLLAVSKVKEGVQAVTSISWKHSAFIDVETLPEEPSVTGPSIKIPFAVRQVYIVNGKTAPLFSAVNPEMKKGFEFRTTDSIREIVSSYIKTKNLVSKTDSKIINLDQVLMDIALNKSVKFQGEWPMKWGEVFDKILKEMTINHEVVFTNGGFVELKGKLVPMDVKVEKKAGNKLVTVIRNLEGLGMEPSEIARELQQVVGATVGIREDGGGQNISHSVTVQGDQTKLLDKFFFQTFSMPKKFVTGLEKPGKKG